MLLRHQKTDTLRMQKHMTCTFCGFCDSDDHVQQNTQIAQKEKYGTELTSGVKANRTCFNLDAAAHQIVSLVSFVFSLECKESEKVRRREDPSSVK